MPFHVYILRCEDASLYVGSTADFLPESAHTTMATEVATPRHGGLSPCCTRGLSNSSRGHSPGATNQGMDGGEKAGVGERTAQPI